LTHSPGRESRGFAMIDRTRTSRTRAALAGVAVRPWHVVFILLVAYAVGWVAGHKLTLGVEPALRPFVHQVVANAIAAAIMAAYAIVVPELRGALASLFARPAVTVRGADIAWAIAAMLCWGYGLYRVAVILPVVSRWPGLFEHFALVEDVPRFEAKYLLMIATMVTAAPLGEELMFRGFLMNLWIARKGTVAGVAWSSVVFGLFHWDSALFAAVLGLILALVYLKYESLWPGICLHAFYNATTSFWLAGGWFATKPRAAPGELSHWAPELVLAILFFPAAWFFWRRFRPGAA